MSKIYGYARCSLAEEKGQDLNRQVRELKAAGAEEIITEREHGDARVKQNLDMLLEVAQPGDTIITLEVSRLSRSTQQLCEIINTIKEKHLRLIIVGSITVDCRSGSIDPMHLLYCPYSVKYQSDHSRHVESEQKLPQLFQSPYIHQESWEYRYLCLDCRSNHTR